jgi:hypothetical protein
MNYKIMTTCFGILALIFALLFIASCILQSVAPPKIGTMWAHVNRGESQDPYKPNRPFVALYVLEEIKDGNGKLHWKSLHSDGSTGDYSYWKKLGEIGRFDEEVRKPPEQ